MARTSKSLRGLPSFRPVFSHSRSGDLELPSRSARLHAAAGISDAASWHLTAATLFRQLDSLPTRFVFGPRKPEHTITRALPRRSCTSLPPAAKGASTGPWAWGSPWARLPNRYLAACPRVRFLVELAFPRPRGHFFLSCTLFLHLSSFPSTKSRVN